MPSRPSCPPTADSSAASRFLVTLVAVLVGLSTAVAADSSAAAHGVCSGGVWNQLRLPSEAWCTVLGGVAGVCTAPVAASADCPAVHYVEVTMRRFEHVVVATNFTLASQPLQQRNISVSELSSLDTGTLSGHISTDADSALQMALVYCPPPNAGEFECVEHMGAPRHDFRFGADCPGYTSTPHLRRAVCSVVANRVYLCQAVRAATSSCSKLLVLQVRTAYAKDQSDEILPQSTRVLHTYALNFDSPHAGIYLTQNFSSEHNMSVRASLRLTDDFSSYDESKPRSLLGGHVEFCRDGMCDSYNGTLPEDFNSGDVSKGAFACPVAPDAFAPDKTPCDVLGSFLLCPAQAATSSACSLGGATVWVFAETGHDSSNPKLDAVSTVSLNAGSTVAVLNISVSGPPRLQLRGSLQLNFSQWSGEAADLLGSISPALSYCTGTAPCQTTTQPLAANYVYKRPKVDSNDDQFLSDTTSGVVFGLSLAAAVALVIGLLLYRRRRINNSAAYIPMLHSRGSVSGSQNSRTKQIDDEDFVVWGPRT